MANLQEDNERLMHDQERILKNLYDHQNHRNHVSSSEDDSRHEEQRQRRENALTRSRTQHLEGDKGGNEEGTDNATNQQQNKKHKTELK